MVNGKWEISDKDNSHCNLLGQTVDTKWLILKTFTLVKKTIILPTRAEEGFNLSMNNSFALVQ